MSIVNRALPDARVLDLFAGSGALGLEALSRGAAVAHFVENSPKSIALINTNAATLGAGHRAVIHRSDAFAYLDRLGDERFDVAFADPPYDKQIATRIAERWLESPFADLLGIEHRLDERLPGSDDRRKYGGTVITFYRTEAPDEDSTTFSVTTDSES